MHTGVTFVKCDDADRHHSGGGTRTRFAPRQTTGWHADSSRVRWRVQDPTQPRYRAGAFGVAMERSDRSLLRFARWTGGMDQISFMADLQGAITVPASAAETPTLVHLIINNKAVQRVVAAKLRRAGPVVQVSGCVCVCICILT